MRDPWLKTELTLETKEGLLRFHVPHDVFSTQRIDEGTLLLLEHLPKLAPTRVLDMGCGYGALGLPVAARYPDAKVLMVDRDLLAVRYSQLNASENKLENVEARGSLGYSNLPDGPFDWILCNVPARIGDAFIQNLVEGAMSRLKPEGGLRIVVIRDLGVNLQRLASLRNWPMVEVSRGSRHTVYSFPRFEAVRAQENVLALYSRDLVSLNEIKLSRPFDFGGDDPKRLALGLPLLLDALPRQGIPSQVFCARSGYGQIPISCAQKWPIAKIITYERDLLGSSFTRLNAETLGISERIEIREASDLKLSLTDGELFDLITLEWSPSAGINYAESELVECLRHLKSNGEVLLLCLEKLERDWLKPLLFRLKFRNQLVAKRDGYAVHRILLG